MQRRSLTLNSSPMSTYLRTNKKHLNELLLREYQEKIQDNIMRVFLECLYGTLDFIRHYLREKDESEPSPVRKLSSTAEKLQLITESTSIIGIDPRNIDYLVEKQSGYDILLKLHHQYSIRTAAIHLEHRGKRYTVVSRTNTILAFWKFLTQYDSYTATYENEEEIRMLTDKDVTEYERINLGDVVVCRL